MHHSSHSDAQRTQKKAADHAPHLLVWSGCNGLQQRLKNRQRVAVQLPRLHPCQLDKAVDAGLDSVVDASVG